MPQLPCNKTILKVCKNSMHLRWGMVLRINDLFPIDPITGLEIKSYIENISYNGSNIEATLTLSENVDDFVSVSDIITFHGDRGLNFHAERNITGVNIIDGMIFWTDNYSEPKKVNIERGKIGSTSWKYGAGYDGSQLRERTTWNGKSNTFSPINNFAYYSDFDQHTKLIIDKSTVHECEKSTIFCPVLGCTDPNATNYDPNATVNDGSCTLPPVPGCTDVTACNYDALANSDDGSCTYPGCTDPLALNYDATAGCDDGLCTYPAIVSGCMDPLANNYDPLATIDDGSCIYCNCEITGCMDMLDINYNPAACIHDNGSCGGSLGPRIGFGYASDRFIPDIVPESGPNTTPSILTYLANNPQHYQKNFKRNHFREYIHGATQLTPNRNNAGSTQAPYSNSNPAPGPGCVDLEGSNGLNGWSAIGGIGSAFSGPPNYNPPHRLQSSIRIPRIFVLPGIIADLIKSLCVSGYNGQLLNYPQVRVQTNLSPTSAADIALDFYSHESIVTFFNSALSIPVLPTHNESDIEAKLSAAGILNQFQYGPYSIGNVTVVNSLIRWTYSPHGSCINIVNASQQNFPNGNGEFLLSGCADGELDGDGNIINCNSYGCADCSAINYDASIDCDDGSCIY